LLDEYEFTDHYRRWAEDLALMAQLGVSCARYGAPWHRVQPEPHAWDFGCSLIRPIHALFPKSAYA
jgi:beta-glucosidase/6-phospho-beta-glucosidase/beta-galactosidase